jgi:GAF domain-containing protein
VQLAGARAYLGVPMLRGEELVDAIVIYRQETRPFTDKQIDLVTNFAAQAVIAIENTRLLDDLSKLNQQLEQRVTSAILPSFRAELSDHLGGLSRPSFPSNARRNEHNPCACCACCSSELSSFLPIAPLAVEFVSRC